jgi:23S rRNA (cytosine1962-C5)-methyltransferase
MRLILPEPSSTITLRLARDLMRVLKRGNPWVFREALRSCPDAPPGTPAVLLDNKRGRPVARGFYDPTSSLAFRACEVDDLDRPLDDAWAAERFQRAWQLRKRLFIDDAADNTRTTAFRLVNGEGDGLPGLVLDLYETTAVLKLDGAGPSGFWNAHGVSQWLATEAGVRSAIERPRERGEDACTLLGSRPTGPVSFLENDVQFTADVLHGQKTGFFLDQRDNRQRIRHFAAGQTVLNLFGYTGGFSVYAGCGDARHVSTVDLAEPAIEAARDHWALNNLPPDRHDAVVADAFEYLAEARRGRRQWDLVVSDPPSFAPSKASLDKALASYQKLATDCAAVTSSHGILALASCSSHVDGPTFLSVIEEGISQARRRATVLAVHSQPPDHPTPLALPEFRYLKFVVLRIDDGAAARFNVSRGDGQG